MKWRMKIISMAISMVRRENKSKHEAAYNGGGGNRNEINHRSGEG